MDQLRSVCQTLDALVGVVATPAPTVSGMRAAAR